MSDLQNITEGIESLSETEKAELLSRLSNVMDATKSRFMADKRQSDLRARYQSELASLNTTGLSSQARVRRITAIKNKYRAQGLEVW